MLKRWVYQIGGKDVLGKVIIEPPYDANLMTLDDEAIVLYVVKGNSVVHTPTQTVHTSPGNCVLINSRKFINRWLENEDNSYAEAILFRFYPEHIQQIYQSNFPETFPKVKEGKSENTYKINANTVIDKFIEHVQQYVHLPELLTEELIALKIKEFLYLLLSLEEKHEVRKLLSGLFAPRESEFVQVVQAHLFDDLSVDELAFLTNSSTSSFKRKFKVEFGTSPGQYIKTRRLEKAAHLLETTTLSINEIAYDVGFNDRSNFTKSFTQFYKHSPSFHRKST